jgi:hypothetical protein
MCIAPILKLLRLRRFFQTSTPLDCLHQLSLFSLSYQHHTWDNQHIFEDQFTSTSRSFSIKLLRTKSFHRHHGGHNKTRIRTLAIHTFRRWWCDRCHRICPSYMRSCLPTCKEPHMVLYTVRYRCFGTSQYSTRDTFTDAVRSSRRSGMPHEQQPIMIRKTRLHISSSLSLSWSLPSFSPPPST